MKKLTCLTAIVVASLHAIAQSAMFTYQGRLTGNMESNSALLEALVYQTSDSLNRTLGRKPGRST